MPRGTGTLLTITVPSNLYKTSFGFSHST